MQLLGRELMKRAMPDDIKELLTKGAGVNARDNRGWSPLHLAAYNNKNDDIKELLAKGADVNARDNRGWSPLHLAAWHNKNPEVVLALLEAGADTHAITADGKTALDLIQKNEALKETKARWTLNDLSYK